VPYGCRVDRVDRWLNAQHSWRRILIAWLVFAPPFLSLGLLWSAWGNFDDQRTVPTGSVLLHVGIAALASIPLAAFRVRSGSRRRKSRPWEPLFSWRMIVGMDGIMITQAFLLYGETRTLTWRHQHLPFTALYLADTAGLILLVWHGRYLRKLRRQAEADPQAAAN
jgi:hypothetical protein